MGGRVEFIEKYFEVIGELLARGFSVAAMDWRGQGRSARALARPEPGHVADFAEFREDLRLFTDAFAKPRIGGPLILLTHSMGGAPALQLLADGYDAYRAAVLSSPMTRLWNDGLMESLARLLAGAASRFGAGERPVAGVKEHSLAFEGNVLTSDRARHARFLALQQAGPDAVIRAPTFGWLKAAIAATDDLHREGRFERLKTPVLILSAEKEKLIAGKDHALIASRSPLIECVTIKGALHEILMERDEIRAEFWKAFDAFVEPRLTT